MLRKIAFLLVTFCEVSYSIIAILSVYFSSIHFNFIFSPLIKEELFFSSLILLSIVFTTFYHYKKLNKYNVPVSIILSLFWLTILTNVLISAHIFITIPFYTFMFLIRILMAVMIEAEVNGISK